jgi:hypothetical protein
VMDLKQMLTVVVMIVGDDDLEQVCLVVGTLVKISATTRVCRVCHNKSVQCVPQVTT